MTSTRFALLPLVLLVGCNRQEKPTPATPAPANLGGQHEGTSLAAARKAFTTQLTRNVRADEPLENPPARVFRTVQYDSPVGKLAAYLTPNPGDGKKHPAIVWITGGDCNTIGDVWSPRDPNNDQAASQYRQAGIVMMFPSLRGGNTNPGFNETFFGEVDDVIAAAEFLAKQDYVDPKRIYLGGHSTGGTLVLLVAECSDRYRAVFSFGPVADITNYPPQYAPSVNTANQREVELRSPGQWLHSIRSPTFVFEGEDGNRSSLETLQHASTNPKAHFYIVDGADHFNILAPTNRLIAQKILKDTGADVNLTFTQAELNKPFGR